MARTTKTHPATNGRQADTQVAGVPHAPPTAAAETAVDVRSLPVDNKRYPIEVETTLSMPMRAAQYLAEAAVKWPYQLISYQEIYRNINLLQKTKGGSNFPDVDRRRTYTFVRSAQRWLTQDFNPPRVVILGEGGARASVNDQDIVENMAWKRAKRIVSAVDAATKVDAIINTKNVSGEMGRWYKKSMRPSLAQMQTMKEDLLTAGETQKALPSKAATE